MIFTVFSTNISPYMQWQSDLLEYSWRRCGQPGTLVRLVATDARNALPLQRHAKCIATELWDRHPVSGDSYMIYNKPASLLEWLYTDRPEGTILLVDPDCVFLHPIDIEVSPGFAISQRWVDLKPSKPSRDHPFGLSKNFSFLNDHCARTDLQISPVMIPTLVHTSDLRMICGRWLELCAIIRNHYRNARGQPVRESDMFAYVIACAEFGIQHQPVTLGICTNWKPAAAPDAPIIHYCQPICDHVGNRIFGKASYAPWELVPTEFQPAEKYGSDLVALVNEYVRFRESEANASAGENRSDLRY